jgi:hypothetical protein
MDARSRRQRIVLGGLLAVLALLVAWQLRPQPTGPAAGRAAPAARRPAAPNKAGPPPVAPEELAVRLSQLDEERPAPRGGPRNPFRFEVRAAAPPPPAAPPAPMSAPTGAEPAVAPGPPPPPPIALKFIGTVSGGGIGGTIAVLSDGKFVYYGREGDIIEGRYRVVKIGEESIQVEHLDGRGRQTIRLTGA